MITLKKNGTIECYCGSIYAFAQEIVDKVLPILDYDIEVCFNDKHFIVNKYDTVESIINKWAEEETK